MKTGRSDPRKVAKRLEAELGEEHASLIEGEPSAWALFPPPAGGCKGGIDGGYVRHGCDQKQTFAVMVGTRIRSFDESEEARPPSRKRLGVVHTRDTPSKRRLDEVVQAQDFQMNQAMPFLSDGDDTLRQLQVEMRPKAMPIWAWSHVTRKRTVGSQCGKGLVQCEAV